MKRIASFFFSLALIALFSTSCEELGTETDFDKSLIIGKWKSGSLYERYDANYSGATWDTADDVTEAEAQTFSWTITQDQLEQIHIIESGGVVPKVYTITELSSTSLKYIDAYGITKSFSRQ